MTDQINQPLTPQDIQSGMQDIRTQNNTRQYNKKIEQTMAQLAKNNKPFCHSCAINDYHTHKKKEQIKAEQTAKKGQQPPTPKEYNPPLSKYTEIMQKINTTTKSHTPLKGLPATITIFHNYQCQECNGIQSIEQTPEHNNPKTQK